MREASVGFNARRAIQWDLWDLCEPMEWGGENILGELFFAAGNLA